MRMTSSVVRPNSFWSLGSKWSNGIEISLQDTRLYRALTLSNDLQVLLVSDSKTEKAAAAMAIQVGHQSDPKDIPGLAHFLEHMLFLGTNKYPDETSYKKYLSAHGGRSNAYTSATDTNFYFDVGPTHLHGALDRFSQFFIEPLFTPSATEREMNAVDAENAKNYQNDGRRLFQLSKTLANPLHPYNKFGTGNLQTLLHHPQSLGLDVRQELLSFYDQFYSANMMKLVVYGRDDLNTLEEWATSMFSPIVNKQVTNTIPDLMHHPYETEQQSRLIQVNPVKDLRILELSFPLPSMYKSYRSKPSRILSHILGHEGKGSLLAYLKRLGYANNLSAGLTKDFQDWAQFTIKVTLTPKGVDHYSDIAQACFHYLDIIRDAAPEKLAIYFEESQKLNMLRFRFRNQERPIDYVSWLSSNMQRYPMEHVISGPSILIEHDDSAVRSVLDLLLPSRVRMILVSKTSTTNAVEKWLHAPYSDVPISQELGHQLKVPLPQHPDSPHHLPLPNPFIPTKFDLIVPNVSDMQVLRDDRYGRVWYKQGNTFHRPKSTVHLKWYTPSAYASPMETALTELYLACIRDTISEDLYDADLAGMDVSVSNSVSGISLHVNGYSETLPLVLARVVDFLAPRAVSKYEMSFQRLHEKLVQGYANAALDEPHQWATRVRQALLTLPKWTTMEKLSAAKSDSFTWEMLQTHATKLLHGAFLESFVYGNTPEDEALAMVVSIESTLQIKSASPEIVNPARVVQLHGDHVYIEKNQNPSNPNAAVHVVWQLGEETTQLRATCTLLAQLLKVPCFSQLRTREQLGYIVFSGQSISNGVVHIYMTIQSNKFNPTYLQERIDSFCASFQDHLTSLTSEEFEKHKDAVVANLLELPKTYEEESSRLWQEIAGETYRFDYRQNLANMVKTLHLGDVQKLYDTSILNHSTRNRLSVQIIAPSDDICFVSNDSGVITDIDAFKRAQMLFPARQSISSSLPMAKL